MVLVYTNFVNIATAVMCILIYASGESEPKGSLVFVIDKTESMKRTLIDVMVGANAIFDTVVNSEKSPIENYVLVMFGDPYVQDAIVTTDRETFKSAFNTTIYSLESGGDCPELALTGIIKALEASLNGSYVYVFTDASAKDVDRFEQVKHLAQKKNCKLVFVLITRQCKDYSVYDKLADATSGQVFNLYQPDIRKILEYVKDSVTSRSISIHSKEYGVGSHSIDFEVDSSSSDVTVSMTKPVNKEEKVEVTIRGPDNETIDDDVLVRLGQILIVKIPDSKPGVYGVSFINEKLSSYAVITARSDVSFRHGFSTKTVPSLDDTVFSPIPAVKNHLIIKLFGDNVQLTSVKFLNKNYHNISEMTLKLMDKDRQLYVTDLFTPPHIPFRIVVKGNHTITGDSITRFGNMVLETEMFDKKKPVVTIITGKKVTVEYNGKQTLDCAVNAYPEPIVIWRYVGDKKELESALTLHPPYNFNRLLELKNIRKNATYECFAENAQGSDTTHVQVDVNPKPYFTIEKTPQDQEFDREARVVLNCKVNSYPPANISWFPENKINLMRKHSNIEISSNNSTLIIKHMKERNGGRYSCVIKYLNKTYKRSASLVLSGKKPRLKKDPWDLKISVKAGDTGVLSCSLIEGKPQPEFLWFRKLTSDTTAKFTKIEGTTNLTTVTLKHLNRFDTGMYKCVAKNRMGQDERFINLSVECQPTIKGDPETTQIVEEYSEVNIECTVEGVPTPEVTWLIDGEPLDIDGVSGLTVYRDHSLRLGKVSSANTGTYTCIATNKLGSAEKSVEVIVEYLNLTPPKNSNISVTANSGITLPCDGEGFPDPTYQWKFYSFDGVGPTDVPDGSDSELSFRKIRKNQAGIYICVATNTYVSKNISFIVDVKYPPEIRDPEPFHKVVEGDLLLKIRCEASGNPKPSITWEMDGLPIKNYSKKIAAGSGIIFEEDWLIMYNITQGEHKYYCEANNGLSRPVISRGVEVEILRYPPPEEIYNTTNMFVEIGTKKDIQCFLSPEKIDWLVWYKDKRLLHFGELKLNKITRSDEGVYTCRVTKPRSLDDIKSANTNVIVGSKPTFIANPKRKNVLKFNNYGFLDCKASSKLTANVTWRHNGYIMKHSEMVYSFKMDTKSVGEYICEISNSFGVSQRIFDVTFEEGDCLLNIESDTDNEPLLLTTSGTWPAFRTKAGLTIVPKNENVGFYCPTKFTYFKKPDLVAKCIGGTIFHIDGTFHDHSNIKCYERVKPRIRLGREKCLGDDTTVLKLVFDIGRKNIEAYEYCLDKLRNPIYAKHVISSPADFIPKNTTTWDNTELKSYSCHYQAKRFSRISINMTGCCFAGSQLVNAKDAFPGPLQRASYNRLNIVPHWSTCHSENWAMVEERVRQFAKRIDSELIVYTGIAGYWYQKLDYKNTLITIKRNLPIGLYLWKVVINPATKSSIAIVQLNVPELSQSGIIRNHVLCRDICHELSWMSSPDWHSVKQGFTYCCELLDFTRAFEKKNIDRDFVKWRVFGPNYDRLN